MARIDLKNEDVSFAFGHGKGVITVSVIVNNTDEKLKAAAECIGNITISLDEVTELIDELKYRAKDAISNL
jgi:hypothetical protein